MANENGKGRKVGDLSFSVAPFLEALARKNLNLPFTLPDDASEKTRASYAKAKAGREAGSKATEIAALVEGYETELRGVEGEVTRGSRTDDLIDIFKDALGEYVAVAAPKQKLRDKLVEREAEIEALRKQLARARKKLAKSTGGDAE